MPTYSGVAATFGPPTPVEQPAGVGMMDLMSKFIDMKNAQKAQALASLEGAMKLAAQGFPVDPKKIQALVKKSDLPISMKTDDVAATLLAMKKGQQQSDKPVGAGGAGASGLAATAGAMAKQNEQKPTGTRMSPEDALSKALNQLADRAKKLANTKAQTDQEKADNELHIEQTRKAALAGDSEARGTLMGLNQWHFDVEWEKWNKMSPEDRVNWARGGETAGDKVKRETGIAETLINNGFADPSTAFQASKALANGQPIPADLQSKMKPKSLENLNQEAQLTEKIADMYPGISGAQLKGAINAAVLTGNLTAGLPTNLKPITPANRQAAAAERSVDIERARLFKEVEVAEMQATGAKAKAELEEAKSIVELAKSGKVSQDLVDGAQIKLADALNMDVTKVKHWWQYVTGGESLQFTPRLTEGGKDLVHKFAGKNKPSKDKPSMIQQVYKGLTDSSDKGPI